MAKQDPNIRDLLQRLSDLSDFQRLGIKRSRIESPGLFPFLGCLFLFGGGCELNFLLGMPPARVLC